MENGFNRCYKKMAMIISITCIINKLNLDIYGGKLNFVMVQYYWKS